MYYIENLASFVIKQVINVFVLQVCVPIALFFINSNKQLVPIAIQLFQQKAPDNPVSNLEIRPPFRPSGYH